MKVDNATLVIAAVAVSAAAVPAPVCAFAGSRTGTGTAAARRRSGSRHYSNLSTGLGGSSSSSALLSFSMHEQRMQSEHQRSGIWGRLRERISSNNSRNPTSASVITPLQSRKRCRSSQCSTTLFASRSDIGSSSSGSTSTTAYDPLNNRHSASDWLYNVRSLPQSKVLREIRNPVMAVFGWSLVVSLVHKLLKDGGYAKLASHLCIPGTAHSFLVSALGLLLVFRTNSAYQRFNEGRKIWENILSVSRNMSRMIQLYGAEVGPENHKRITNLVAAYPYLLRQHIRPGCLCSDDFNIPPPHRLLLHEQRHIPHETRHEGQEAISRRAPPQRVSRPVCSDDMEDSMRGSSASSTSSKNGAYDCWVDKRALPWSLFLPQSLPAIARTENRPLWVCDRMAALICQIPYGPNFTSRERLTLLGMVDKLTNAVGQCERIHQTAVPLNYARHSLRSLTLWLFTLPFCLVNDLGLFTAPANAAIAWLFFGVYQIGYSIEDPFQGSLRLSILCDAIRRSVIRQTTDMEAAAAADKDDSFQHYSSHDSDPLYEDSKPLGGQSTSDGEPQPWMSMESLVQSATPESSAQTSPLFSSSASTSESRIVQAIRARRRSQDRNNLQASHEGGCDDELDRQLLLDQQRSAKSSIPAAPPVVKRVTVDMAKSLQEEIQQKLSLPTTPQPLKSPATKTTVEPSSESLPVEQQAASSSSSSDPPQPPQTEQPLSSSSSPPPLWIDEELLHVPKIVRRHSNGTWTEVGI